MPIPLTFYITPDAVLNTTYEHFRQTNLPEQPLPDETSLLQVYDQTSGELLVLGDLGSGKTTLLLKLAEVLQQRAALDEQAPFPVVVNLSSWATKRRPLQDWLIEEIARTYTVPRPPIAQWILEDQILPLLDGLDEVGETAREACIRSINLYHHQHLGPLVVCSRKDEYQVAAQQTRLTLHKAVTIQPLTVAQINTYLKHVGPPLAALRTTLKNNEELRQLSMTPLMLSILSLTYQEKPLRIPLEQRSNLQQKVIKDYVWRLMSQGNTKRYSPQVTYVGLGWLAHQLRKHNQPNFFLEDLQQDWLPRKQQSFYKWSVRLTNGFLGLLVGGIINGVIGGKLDGIISSLIGLLIFLCAFGRDLSIKPREAVAWSPQGARWGWVLGLAFSVSFKTVFGLALRAMNPLSFFLMVPAFTCMGVLAWGLSEKQIPRRDYRTPNEGIQRSAKIGWAVALLVSVFPAIWFGTLFGPVDGLALGIFGIVILGQMNGLQAVMRHFILRFWLWHTHLCPWRVASFLNDATARILLKRVGGSYSFSHRLLLDYFADNYALIDSSTDWRK
ncbi:hypothetical protein ccbrp13_21580 [Ktedonobacteria bacterium brp13]|nr:hypothetical protein ccbrp13_21580 [Ktedonobacteria bacterium brp13]